jgi:hypothetical protein
MRYTSVILTKGDVDDDWWEDAPFTPHLQVDGATMEFTGLLDSGSNPIFKLPRPIGFGRDAEW